MRRPGESSEDGASTGSAVVRIECTARPAGRPKMTGKMRSQPVGAPLVGALMKRAGMRPAPTDSGVTRNTRDLEDNAPPTKDVPFGLARSLGRNE